MRIADQNSLEHEKEEQITKLKGELEQLDNTLNSEKGLHEVKLFLKEADDLHGGKLAEAATDIYLRAIDAAGNAEVYAANSQNTGMQARIEAKIGEIYFRCLHKTEA